MEPDVARFEGGWITGRIAFMPADSGALDMESKSGNFGIMKTTVDIPEEMLGDAMRYAKAPTKRAAVLRAIEEFNRRQRMTELVKYSGTCERLMSNEEMEAQDGARDRRLSGRRNPA